MNNGKGHATKVPFREKQSFTTGDISAICHVAARTCHQWCAKGLLAYHRIPGSKDRRIQRKDLIRFMLTNRLPIPDELAHDLDGTRVLLVTEGAPLSFWESSLADADIRASLRTAADAFSVGLVWADWLPDVVCIDLHLGRGEMLALCRRLAAWAIEQGRELRLVALAGEEAGDAEREALLDAGFDEVVVKPLGAGDVARVVRGEE